MLLTAAFERLAKGLSLHPPGHMFQPPTCPACCCCTLLAAKPTHGCALDAYGCSKTRRTCRQVNMVVPFTLFLGLHQMLLTVDSSSTVPTFVSVYHINSSSGLATLALRQQSAVQSMNLSRCKQLLLHESLCSLLWG